MDNLFLTLMIAFVVIVFAIACLAIGWLFTGKIRIDRCGKDPTKKKDQSCDSAPCELCKPENVDKNKDKKSHDLPEK